MSDTNKKVLAPTLRFPEFSKQNDWIYKELGRCLLSKPSYGINAAATPYKANLPTYIRITDISEEGYYIKGKKVSVNADNSDQYYLVSGDLVLARTGASVGKSYQYREEDGELVFAGFLIKVSPDKNKLNPGFLFQYFKTEEYWKWVNVNSARSGQPGINGNEFASLPIPLPINLNEQQKIADFLTSIDDLIIAYTKKLDTIRAHKKGLMQGLFPAEGGTIPKLRFAEFSNAGHWKKRNFSTLFEIGGGKDHKHLPNGDIPVYGSGGYMRSVNSFLYDGESACIGRKGTINKPMFLEGKFWTVDTLFYTHSFKGCSPKFVYLLFQNINWLKLNEAGGVPSLSKVIINKVEARVPSVDEQNEIVKMIWSVDRLISEQGHKITSLKAHKKGLMQKLFPAVNEGT